MDNQNDQSEVGDEPKIYDESVINEEKLHHDKKKHKKNKKKRQNSQERNTENDQTTNDNTYLPKYSDFIAPALPSSTDLSSGKATHLNNNRVFPSLNLYRFDMDLNSSSDINANVPQDIYHFAPPSLPPPPPPPALPPQNSSNDIFTISQPEININSNSNHINESESGYIPVNNMKAKKLKKNKKIKKCIAFSIIFGCIAVVCLVIILVIVFAFLPCNFAKCHKKASTCINRLFKAECVCDFGYNGDGLNYCDGNITKDLI
jgi:hypothetical protein